MYIGEQFLTCQYIVVPSLRSELVYYSILVLWKNEFLHNIVRGFNHSLKMKERPNKTFGLSYTSFILRPSSNPLNIAV